MKINIKKYAQMSYISINESERQDIEKGVLDILNYVTIIQNVSTGNQITNNNNLNTQYRTHFETSIIINNLTQEILFENAPKLIKNYFIVPDLIIRKS